MDQLRDIACMSLAGLPSSGRGTGVNSMSLGFACAPWRAGCRPGSLKCICLADRCSCVPRTELVNPCCATPAAGLRFLPPDHRRLTPACIVVHETDDSSRGAGSAPDRAGTSKPQCCPAPAACAPYPRAAAAVSASLSSGRPPAAGPGSGAAHGVGGGSGGRPRRSAGAGGGCSGVGQPARPGERG